MSQVIYRDIACTDGCEVIAKIASRMVLNGWSYVAYSTGAARIAGTPASEAALITALSTGSGAWVLLSRGSRAVAFKRTTSATHTWDCRYTCTGSLSGGNATTPDNNANTQILNWGVGVQVFPSTGTLTMKAHIVVEDSDVGVFASWRRSPWPGGSNSGNGYFVIETVIPATWAANPDPVAVGFYGADGNTGIAGLLSGNNNCYAWYKRGLSGEAFNAGGVENPASVMGSATADPSGSDVEHEVRWVFSGPFILGKSALLKGLQPFISPIVGLDSGGTLNRACFGQISCVNNGTALGS